MNKIKGSLQDFLDAVLDFESGIYSSRHEWYVQNYHKKVIQHVEVAKPGRLIREWDTGSHRLKWLSVFEYFQSLGVEMYFDISSPESIQNMRYRCINGWGFVGYQFGEDILWTSGYYEPENVQIEVEHQGLKTIRRYYLGSIPNREWRFCKTEILAIDPNRSELMIATDVNRWHGRFTGLDGIHSFSDLLIPSKQNLVICRTLRLNMQYVKQITREAGLSWEDVLDKRWKRGDLACQCTESGILASTHLRGAPATSELIIYNKECADELGTSILVYMDLFGGYDVSGL